MTEEDEVTWAREQGLPAFTDPALRQYLLGRDKLIQQERKQRSDYAFRESLSPVAAEACRIVSHIRGMEQHTVWTNQQEADLAKTEDDTIYPGMMFSKARKLAETTSLWRIVQKMPKGALLHCHLSGMVDVDWLLDELFRLGGMHMSAASSLHTDESRATETVLFRWRKANEHQDSCLWDKSYIPDSFVAVEKAADTFPNGGRQAFRAWFRSRSTITEDEHMAHHRGPAHIWDKFASIFPFLDSLFYYEPLFRSIVHHILAGLVDDGIKYVEFRSTFRSDGLMYASESENPDADNTSIVRALDEAIQSFMETSKGQHLWDAKLIWYTNRANSTQNVIESMKECIRLKQEFPDLIAGYDLVGHEDAGRPLTDLLPELFWFKKTCAENEFDIPMYLHAGETLGDGSETDENLYDAILLGARRIGHGFSLQKHPLLMDMVKDKHILIESCPISNEVLRYTSSIMTHPLPALLAKGIPVALGSDDPGIMGQGCSGMTHNFWQALQAWENLGLEGLASLAENSIRYAIHEDCRQKQWIQEIKDGSMGKSLRAKRLREWSLQWEKYCQWIVEEFGQQYLEEEVSDSEGSEAATETQVSVHQHPLHQVMTADADVSR